MSMILGEQLIINHSTTIEIGELPGLSNLVNNGIIKVGLFRDKGQRDIKIKTKKGEELMISSGHAYSIEKTYYDTNLKKDIVVFINPWHTEQKYEITFDDCSKIFNFEITYVNIKKMFR